MKKKLAMFFEDDEGKLFFIALVNRKNGKLDLLGGNGSLKKEIQEESHYELDNLDSHAIAQWGESRKYKTKYYVGFFRLKIFEKIKTNYEQGEFEEHTSIKKIYINKIEETEGGNKHLKWLKDNSKNLKKL